jgi:hypothetical protein
MPRAALLAPALLLALAAPLSPVMAQAEENKSESLEETARSAIQSLMEVMQAVIDKIPMYEAPVILENGDILIRRKQPDPPPQQKPPPEGQTRT